MPLFCSSCGAEAAPDAKFCSKCGAAIKAAAPGAPSATIRAATTPGSSSKAGEKAGEKTPAATFKPSAAAAPAKAASTSGPTDILPEVELWSGSYCWKHMIGSWIVAVLVTIGIFVFAYFLAKVPQVGDHALMVWLSAAGLVAAIWVYLLLILLYRQLAISYRLTNEILTIQRGVVSITQDRLELQDVDDITVEQGLVDRMLGIGTIVIRSSDVSDPVLPLEGINDVQTVADLLDKTRRKKRARGMKVV